ncbi:hypothetical protein [Geminicoccus roseus]|uniref:hypothetical protein n=1 Tax=Geminicoccus roseus TaxID=404900 RepID=UPI0004084770|nr:hypothetical protein [Geminicoccus roseus]
MKRSLALVLLAVALAPLPAQAAICPAIPLPPELGLTCTEKPGDAFTPPSATISPEGSLFSAFTGLTIRKLGKDEQIDDVPAWLRQQVTVDLSGLGSFFSGLADDPDLPVQNDGLAQSLEDTGAMISSLGDLPLSGCGEPELGSSQSDLVCHWDTSGLGLDMQVRLVDTGTDRYALRAWSMNDRRFRQLQALANGFDPARLN